MKYCPRCGGVEKHNPNCSLVIKGKKKRGGWTEDPEWGKGKRLKMLPVTIANYFCGYCNKVFAAGVKKCSHCHRETRQITETHLKSNVLLLSGSQAAKIWDPPV